MRNRFYVHETRLLGDFFDKKQTVPTKQSLEGRGNVEFIRIKTIFYSRRSYTDYDLHGLKIENNLNETSNIIGE